MTGRAEVMAYEEPPSPAPKPRPVRVTRHVPREDHNNFLGRDVEVGELFFVATVATYGCIASGGVALTKRPNEYPFFEFPEDAIEEVR